MVFTWTFQKWIFHCKLTCSFSKRLRTQLSALLLDFMSSLTDLLPGTLAYIYGLCAATRKAESCAHLRRFLSCRESFLGTHYAWELYVATRRAMKHEYLSACPRGFEATVARPPPEQGRCEINAQLEEQQQNWCSESLPQGLTIFNRRAGARNGHSRR